MAVELPPLKVTGDSPAFNLTLSVFVTRKGFALVQLYSEAMLLLIGGKTIGWT